MLVHVTNVYNNYEGQLVVNFESRYGAAEAIWKNEHLPLEQDYYVEFAVMSVLSWGYTIKLVHTPGFMFRRESDTIMVQGVLEHYLDETNISTVRIGEGLLDIETFGTPPLVGHNVIATIPTISLEMYDIML